MVAVAIGFVILTVVVVDRLLELPLDSDHVGYFIKVDLDFHRLILSRTTDNVKGYFGSTLEKIQVSNKRAGLQITFGSVLSDNLVGQFL